MYQRLLIQINCIAWSLIVLLTLEVGRIKISINFLYSRYFKSCSIGKMKALKKFYWNFISNRIHISLKPLTDWLTIWSLYKERKEKQKSGIKNLCELCQTWTQILNKIHCLFKIESLFVLFVVPNALLYRSSNCVEIVVVRTRGMVCEGVWGLLGGGFRSRGSR